MLDKIRPQLQSLRHDLGRTGQLALILLALAGVLYKAAIEPLQARAQRLAAEVERQAGRQDGSAEGRGAGAAGKLETFYRYLRHEERTTDWLAKLYAIGQATGVELRAGDYRMLPAGDKGAGRIERYEITLPVTGTYAQMRDFLKRSLAEIPVLSLDQVNLKRETRNEGAVHAELKLTLHMVKP